VRLRKRDMSFVVVVGIGALLIGGAAQSQTPTASIVASATENTFKTSSGGAPNVTIAAGGTVEFSYPPAGVTRRHNVAFTALSPTLCTQTEGPSSGPVPPLPNQATLPGWAGNCVFQTAGAYPFVCAIHPNMTGSVTVTAAETPPPPGPPPPPSAEPPGPVMTPPPPPPPPPARTGPAASELRLAAVQRGFTIRGSIKVRSAGSRLLARAFARRKALIKGASTRQVQIGRQLRRPVGGRRVAFAVRLDAKARRTLRRNGRLAISLRLSVTPSTGKAYTATRRVLLRVV
jgi:plastocyanin